MNRNSSNHIGQYTIYENSIIYQYLIRKTKAADRSSKSRRSLGNLYALYVLCEDYVHGNEIGSTFTDLMNRMKSMPFGEKLQNHPLDNRLNDEVKRQYNVPDHLLPVQSANPNGGVKARKISVHLLSENGMDPKQTAAYVIKTIDQYIQDITDNQTAYLYEVENAQTGAEITNLIEQAFRLNSDARLFEIISFALLYLHFQQYEATITLNGRTAREKLYLYRTGRTNANDGGIDFVLKPLGRFFQVTETLDFRKYFLDFDKTNKFPISFVIKTDLTPDQVYSQILDKAKLFLNHAEIDRYMPLFEKIYTLNDLRNILSWIQNSSELIYQLKEIIISSFKIEFGILD